MTIITRFAPSPTGYLHVGGARTALFNYLFTKKNGGKFLLRIEDTDRQRWNKLAETAIFEGLEWLGVAFDGSPISQYGNKERHLEVAKQMEQNGSAYRCFLTQTEYRHNKEIFEKANSGKKYLSPWRECSGPKGKPFVLRFKSPIEGVTNVVDLIQGDLRWKNQNLDDFVLVRSNGDPTYMLSAVVDDRDMQISHVIRGDDHLTNAARQTLIFKLNNWAVPKFAHIPLLHGADGSKLSKRHGALGIESYRTEGYPSEAVVNYLLGLGWHFPNKEIFSINEAKNIFDLSKVGKAPSRFDKEKLAHISGLYIQNSNQAELRRWFSLLGSSSDEITHNLNLYKKIYEGLDLFKYRAKTLNEIKQVSFFLHCNERDLINKQKLTQLSNDGKELVKKYKLHLEQAIWTKDFLSNSLNLFIKNNNINFKDLGLPLRIILTGSKNAPGIIDILLLLGKTKTENRINNYLNKITC